MLSAVLFALSFGLFGPELLLAVLLLVARVLLEKLGQIVVHLPKVVGDALCVLENGCAGVGPILEVMDDVPKSRVSRDDSLIDQICP